MIVFVLILVKFKIKQIYFLWKKNCNGFWTDFKIRKKIINEIFAKYPQIKKSLFMKAVQKEISAKIPI